MIPFLSFEDALTNLSQVPAASLGGIFSSRRRHSGYRFRSRPERGGESAADCCSWRLTDGDGRGLRFANV